MTEITESQYRECPKCHSKAGGKSCDGVICIICGAWIMGEIKPVTFQRGNRSKATDVPDSKAIYSIVERRNNCLLFIKRYFETIKTMLESGASWQAIDDHYASRTTLMDISTLRKYYREEYARLYGVSVQDQKQSGGNSKYDSRRWR